VDEEARNRATEFLKELYAAGDIDAGRFDAGVAGLLAATSDAELRRRSWRRRPGAPRLTGQ
jgi:16S rRNA U516 pseudouridylate synthase RsuA-like enzyme